MGQSAVALARDLAPVHHPIERNDAWAIDASRRPGRMDLSESKDRLQRRRWRGVTSSGALSITIYKITNWQIGYQTNFYKLAIRQIFASLILLNAYT